MPLESILSHISDEARAQKEKIIQQAQEEAEKIIQQAQEEAKKTYQEILDKEKDIYARERQRLIVSARIEAKKNLLKTKQELMDTVFKDLRANLKKETFKKEQVYLDKVKQAPEDVDFYLGKIRQEYETEIASLLFNE